MCSSLRMYFVIFLKRLTLDLANSDEQRALLVDFMSRISEKARNYVPPMVGWINCSMHHVTYADRRWPLSFRK